MTLAVQTPMRPDQYPWRPPIDWARALLAHPSLSPHEEQRVMFWLRAWGWRSCPPRKGDTWWIWLDPLIDDVMVLEYARRTQAARIAQVILEPIGWRAETSGHWSHLSTVRCGSIRGGVLDAIRTTPLTPLDWSTR